MDITALTLEELAAGIARKEVSCRETAEAYLAAVRERDPRIRAYLSLNERLTEEAAAADERLARGEAARPLEGVPVAVKDNICVRGLPATCASKILEPFVPPYDATVIKRLKEAGALVLGKTNMDEFAFGSSTESSAFAVTRNPADPERVPGGSSGGSAAAVGAGLCAAALGSDTGGSIRQPAGFCGVVGFKPTYGRVSRYGLIAFASSLDQIGPLTRNVADCCRVLAVISGKDPRDATSADVPVPDYSGAVRRDLAGMRLGVPKEYFIAGVDPQVESAVRRGVRRAEELGAEVRELSLPHTSFGIAVYYIVATAEASSNLARYDGIRYGFRAAGGDLRSVYRETRGAGFGPEVKRRVILGTYVLSSGYYEAYYLKAQKVRTLIAKDFLDVFAGGIDAVLTPTTPELPFPVGEKTGDPLRMYLSDIFTVNVNLAGLPSVSIPAGRSAEGLPIGLQIIGPHFGEETVLGVASALETALQTGNA